MEPQKTDRVINKEHQDNNADNKVSITQKSLTNAHNCQGTCSKEVHIQANTVEGDSLSTSAHALAQDKYSNLEGAQANQNNANMDLEDGHANVELPDIGRHSTKPSECSNPVSVDDGLDKINQPERKGKPGNQKPKSNNAPVISPRRTRQSTRPRTSTLPNQSLLQRWLLPKPEDKTKQDNPPKETKTISGAKGKKAH
jgi:hypothetical protein